MGYYMRQTDAKFTIAASKHAAALEKLKELLGRADLMGGGSSDGRGGYVPHFSFVRMEDARTATNLADAMDAFRWPVEQDAEGNITAIRFAGEKLGEDEHFFAAIAAFVDDGSFIAMRGETGSGWRWVFSKGAIAGKRWS
jgi:hypothetical protein